MSEEPIPHWPGELVRLGGDHQVYVRSTPGEGGEPALCVHGLAGSSRNWTDLMDLLRPTLACEAVDLPGFGESPPRPDGRYSIAAFAQTVIALIKQSKRGPVHLIGNSLGGAVCLKVAAARPRLVRTLTLISPALPDLRPRLDLVRFPAIALPRVGSRLIRRYQAALPPERRVAAVIATCYSNPGLFPQARFAAEAAELSRRDSVEYAAAALMGSARALTSEFLRRDRHSPWRDAALVTAPTLVIYGQHDRLVDPRRWSVPAWWRPKSASSWRPPTLPPTGARRLTGPGNSRSLPPVDGGTGGGRSTRPVRSQRSSRKHTWRAQCRFRRWSSPPPS